MFRTYGVDCGFYDILYKNSGWFSPWSFPSGAPLCDCAAIVTLPSREKDALHQSKIPRFVIDLFEKHILCRDLGFRVYLT